MRTPRWPLEDFIPPEIASAGDVDFIGVEYIDIDGVPKKTDAQRKCK